MEQTEASIVSPEEIGKGLLNRLLQLSDRPRMIAVLGKGLGQISKRVCKVEDYTIHFSKVSPASRLSVYLEALVRPSGEDRPYWQRLSCLFFPTPEHARREFSEYSAEGFSPTQGEKLESDGFHSYAALLEEPPMILGVFPWDLKLKGLPFATDPECMSSLFSEHVGECKVLNYKPGFSCTLRYTLASKEPSSKRDVYAKLYADESDKKSYLLLKTCWEISTASSGSWTAARPISHLPERSLVLQEAVPGRELRKIFSRKINQSEDSQDVEDVEHTFVKIISALRSFQTSGIEVGPVRDFHALLAEQENHIPLLRNCQKGVGEDINTLRQRILNLEPGIPSSPMGFCHGDFAYWNILVDEEKNETIAIIDFDRAGVSEWAYDPAYFLIQICSLAYRKPDRFSQYMRLYSFFRKTYLDWAVQVSSARLALYEALELSSCVLRSFRKNSQKAEWLDWAKNLIHSANDCLSKAADQ